MIKCKRNIDEALLKAQNGLSKVILLGEMNKSNFRDQNVCDGIESNLFDKQFSNTEYSLSELYT